MVDAGLVRLQLFHRERHIVREPQEVFLVFVGAYLTGSRDKYVPTIQAYAGLLALFNNA